MPITESTRLKCFYHRRATGICFLQNYKITSCANFLLQSHWDKLPEELKCYVLDLATWQCIRDRRNNKLLNELHKKILDYGELKRHWGYGHIEIRLKKSLPYVCRAWRLNNPHYYNSYYAHYVNIHQEKKRVVLGGNIRDALNNASSIKKSKLFTRIAHVS